MKKNYIIPSIRIVYPKMRLCHYTASNEVNRYTIGETKSIGNTVED